MTHKAESRWILTGLICGLGVADRAFAAPGIEQSSAHFAVGGALTVTALAIALWAYLLGREAVHRGRIARRSADRLTAILSSAPSAYLAWDGDGTFSASTGLASWLGLDGPVSRLSDLLDGGGRYGFSEADFARIEEAAAAIRSSGPVPPDFEVSAAGRSFRVSATRITAGKAGDVALLWFVDNSKEHRDILERTRQTDRLEAENHGLRTILNALDFPVWRRGADLALAWVNTAYVKAVEGGAAEDVLANRVELVANMLSGGGQSEAARALASEAPLHSRHYVVIDGQRRALSTVNIPVGQAAEAAVVGYAFDSTELEEIRAEIARYTESHAETLNKLSTAVAIFGSDKTLEFYNSAYVRLWRLPEELLAVHPHHGELLEAMRERRRLPEQADFPAWKKAHLAHYTEILEPVEEMWHLPDETTLRVVTQPHPLGGLLILYEDVTDRLALERSYNTLIAVQRATLNNLHEGVAVFGSDGRLSLHNPAFCDIWRLDDARLAQSPHVSALVEECAALFDMPDQYEIFRDAFTHDHGDGVLKNGRLRRADGSEIVFNAVPLPDGATLFTFLDITASVAVERALRERNEALETADRLKTEFVAHISYELRTPLNNVMGFAELLDKEYYGPLNAQQHTYTRNILESSALLMVLINDILDLAVVESGGMKLELSRFEIGRMLSSVAGMAREEIRNRRHRFTLQCPGDIGLIEADERRIRQVMYNLLSNAMKFTPPEGRIAMAAKGDGDFIHLSVSDTGIGISEDEQEDVFASFHTGRDAPRGHGAGLGLSLVRSFIELHGGRIELTSKPNKGTIVVCSLPRRQSADRHRSQQDAAEVQDVGLDEAMTKG